MRHSYPDPVERKGNSEFTLRKTTGFFDAFFENELQKIMMARPILATGVALELSGGMDSASVAIALRREVGVVHSRGIILEGPERAPQIGRRRQVARQLKLKDRTIEMADFLPSLNLNPESRKKEHPSGEFYLEAFESIWADASECGASYLFTGVGGDELFPLFEGEMDPRGAIRKQKMEKLQKYSEQILSPQALTAARSMRAFDAPASPVPTTSLMAHLCRTPYMLQHGLWPINPLSDPNLTEYCHNLPYSFRISREIMRNYLNKYLKGNIFPVKYAKETFARVLPEKIAREKEKIAAQLNECALADLGLVNRRKVLKLLEEVAVTRSEDKCGPLAAFLWMERFIRQVA